MRVVAKRLERVDLLSDAHRAQFGGDVRSNATGESQTRQHWRQFHRDRLLDERSDEVERDGASKRVACEKATEWEQNSR